MDLASVFRSHIDADRMAPEDVRDLFSPPPGFSACLRVENQILLGPRGSGKSMALRWLSYLEERPESAPHPPFYGIRLTIGSQHVDAFKQHYERDGSYAPFFTYFNLALLEVIGEELTRDHWPDDVSLSLPVSFARQLRRVGFTASQLSGESLPSLFNALDDAKLGLKKSLGFNSINPRSFGMIETIDDAVSLVTRFQRIVAEHTELQYLAILLDGFDHLKGLGEGLLPLLAKDEPHSGRIVFKAAARELPHFLRRDGGRRSPEEGRDYVIIPIGLYDEAATYQDHLRRVMCQRMVKYLADNEILPPLDAILVEDSKKYSGFSELARLSSGNVLVFLETCALALSHEQEASQDDLVTRLSPAAQRSGAKQRAELYLGSDLYEQAGAHSGDLRDILRALGSYLGKEGKSLSPIDLKREKGRLPEGLNIGIDEAIARLCELRYLVVPRARLVPVIKRAPGFQPSSFSVSPTLAPAFSLGLDAHETIPMSLNDIDHWFGILRKEHQRQLDLFGSGRVVFLSVAGGDWALETKRRVETAYRNISKHLDSGMERLSVMTYADVSQYRTGNYRKTLIDVMRRSPYIVFDVSNGPTAGVEVEAGIAAGLRKPHAFIWQTDRMGAFDLKKLPAEIGAADVKVREHANNAFYRWFHDHVHQPCSLCDEMCAFKSSGSVCDCTSEARKPSHVYLRIHPRNSSVRQTLVKELEEKGIRCHLATESSSLTAETCKELRRCAGAVIDVTNFKEESSSLGEDGRVRYGRGSQLARHLLEAGYVMGAGIPYGLVFDQERGSIQAPMLPENRTAISAADPDRSVAQFAKWFVRNQMERRVVE